MGSAGLVAEASNELLEAVELVEAVRMAGVRSQMFSFVTQPWAREGKRVVGEARLGTLRAIHADLHERQQPD